MRATRNRAHRQAASDAEAERAVAQLSAQARQQLGRYPGQTADELETTLYLWPAAPLLELARAGIITVHVSRHRTRITVTGIAVNCVNLAAAQSG